MTLGCDFPLFIVGIIVLLVGKIRVYNNKTIYGSRARLIAVLLMSPTLLVILGSLLGVGWSSNRDGWLYTLYGVALCLAPIFTLGLGLMTPKTITVSAPTILTIPETAHRLQITEQAVLELIENGRLKATKIGSHYRVSNQSIDTFQGITATENK